MTTPQTVDTAEIRARHFIDRECPSTCTACGQVRPCETTVLCDALDAARLLARNMETLWRAFAAARAEVARLLGCVLQEQAWGKKRTEEFTSTLAGVVTTAGAEQARLLDRAEKAAAQVATVRALHVPGEYGMCTGCGDDDAYPCLTIRRLDGRDA